MVPGDRCPNPKCKSKNVGDGEMHYTYENPSRVSASWSCQDCGYSYEVLFKAEEMRIVPFIVDDDGYEDLDFDKEYYQKI